MPLDKKKKICKFSFDGEGNHVALTHKLQGFSANNRPDPLIVKSDQIIFNDDIKNDLLRIEKSKSEGDSSVTLTNGVSQEKEKSTGDKMDKVEIEKAKLDALEKAAQEVAELKKQLEDNKELIEKAKKDAHEAKINEKVSIVKALGFVSEEAEQVALATALVKAASFDLDSAKAIELALEKAKAAVDAVVQKELGHKEESKDEDSLSAGIMKAVKNLNKKQ